ncbi:type II toxin-antitoxin system RelE/ParE family toxin [Ningiella sp. W23]
MTAYKVSEQAFDDLLNIGSYTETEWGVNQRDIYLDDIESQFERLAKNH